jgi:hypothetical protein
MEESTQVQNSNFCWILPSAEVYTSNIIIQTNDEKLNRYFEGEPQSTDSKLKSAFEVFFLPANFK